MQFHSIPVAIIGAGPAGLMAAQVLSEAGIQVDVFDAMPSVGRKFLLAGRGGLNLTHSEPYERFVTRYGSRQDRIEPWLADFNADALRCWAKDLGVETFVGTSGRVFPTEMKAAPLLRAWLQRLRHPVGEAAPVRFHMRHKWVGWMPTGADADTDAGPTGQAFGFETPTGQVGVVARKAILALGGASWPRLGSDGAWVPWLVNRNVQVAPLVPANCGFDVEQTTARQADLQAPDDGTSGWSAYFRQRYAGQPLKSVALCVRDAQGTTLFEHRGEFVITETGVEGSLIYAASAWLRDELSARGSATFWLDLLPSHSVEQVHAALDAPRQGQSFANHLRKRLKLEGVKAALLHEVLSKETLKDSASLARLIKALPLTLVRPRPLPEAISTAGGVCFDMLDDALQIIDLPGVYCAGEMLDWEAPTGGYLLTACMASGVRAARGVLQTMRP